MGREQKFRWKKEDFHLNYLTISWIWQKENT